MKTALLSNKTREGSATFTATSFWKDRTKEIELVHDMASVSSLLNKGTNIKDSESDSRVIVSTNTINRIKFEKNCRKEIILPEPSARYNWVVFEHGMSDLVELGNYEFYPIFIKCIKNKHKIMGCYEPLICDIPFAALRLTYLDDTVGWVLT
jgi:hypothetical protein